MTRIIITEITRFSNPDIVCCAGISTLDGTCMRPIPYLNAARCRELRLAPGAIMSGTFMPAPAADAPHIEDANYCDLHFHGPCDGETFRSTLESSACFSIAEGFGVDMSRPEKCLSKESSPACSLITIKVDPKDVHLTPNQYNPRKIQADFTDGSSKKYRFLTVTDLGVNDFVGRSGDPAKPCREMEKVLHSQHEVFIRIGLSRHHAAPNGKTGFWLQVNGIYSFPDFFRPARTYGKIQ